jgi:hypothetical protein
VPRLPRNERELLELQTAEEIVVQLELNSTPVRGVASAGTRASKHFESTASVFSSCLRNYKHRLGKRRIGKWALTQEPEVWPEGGNEVLVDHRFGGCRTPDKIYDSLKHGLRASQRQCVQTFCSVGVGKAKKFNGNTHWVLRPGVLKPALPASVPGGNSSNAVRGKVESLSKTNDPIPEFCMPGLPVHRLGCRPGLVRRGDT